MWKGRAELDGNAVLNQHRVQVVVRDGEALIALADVVRDLGEVLTERLNTPPRGLLHKMDVWEVAKRPLQDKEPGAETKPSHLTRSFLWPPTSCFLSPTPLKHPCHAPAQAQEPRTLSSGSRQRVQSTKSTMHVVFTSGKVSM